MSDAARRAMIDMGLRLEREGLVIGTYGNLAVRTEQGMLVTPTRVDYKDLVPDDIVSLTLDGKVEPSRRLPSSETSVHRLILAARDDVTAVIHTHALHATAVSCTNASIPVIVEEQAQVLGGEIPCTRYVPAGKHRELGEEVVRALGAGNAVLLANHGLVTCGRSLEEAYFATLVAERVARMWLLTGGSKGASTIPDALARSERERYLYRYGTPADRTA